MFQLGETMFTIRKAFDFCYGHRVWPQQLEVAFSGDIPCSCRHLHGHQGRVEVELCGSTLDTRGMITDFNNLNWLKVWLDRTIDHRMLLDVHDPLLPDLISGGQNMEMQEFLTYAWKRHSFGDGTSCYWQFDGFGAEQPKEDVWEKVRRRKDANREMLEGLTVVPFVPTSERLACFVFEYVEWNMQELLKASVSNQRPIWVKSVKWEETPKSSSTYSKRLVE